MANTTQPSVPTEAAPVAPTLPPDIFLNGASLPLQIAALAISFSVLLLFNLICYLFILSRRCYRRWTNYLQTVGTPSTRARIAQYFERESLWWVWLELFNGACSIAHVVLFFVLLGNDFVTLQQFSLELALAIVFTLIFFWRLYIAESRSLYLRSSSAIVDAATVFPIYASLILDSYAVLGFLRILRLFRLAILSKKFGATKARYRAGTTTRRVAEALSSGLYTQFALLVYQLIALVVFSASAFQYIEEVGDFWVPVNERETQSIGSFESIYFIFVTMSTVGYGDISPNTQTGRVVVIILIVWALFVLTSRLSRIASVLAARPVELGDLSDAKSSNYVIITGSITEQALETILRGLFASEKYYVRQPHVGILDSGEGQKKIKQILINPIYTGHIYYRQGSAMRPSDLRHMDLGKARKVFILSNPLSETPEQEDETNILRLWSIKNYKTYGVDVYIQLIKAKSKKRLLSLPADFVRAEHVMCIEELKYAMLASSCLYPGIISLLTNMIRRTAYLVDRSVVWKEAYEHGANYSLYAKTLSQVFDNINFMAAVNLMYTYTHGELLIIGVIDRIDGRRVLLNPGKKYVLLQGDTVLAMAYKEKMADKLELEPTKLHQERNKPLEQELRALGVSLPNSNKLSKAEKECRSLEKQNYRIAKKLDQNAQRMVRLQAGLDKKISRKAKRQAKLGEEEKMVDNDRITSRRKVAASVQKIVHALPHHHIPRHDVPSELNTVHPISRDNYALLRASSQKDFSSALVSGKELSKFKGHIICIGDVSNIFYFIARLRDKNLERLGYVPIVIMNETFGADEWKRIQAFPEIYILRKSPLSNKNLIKANVEKAMRIVIFSKPSPLAEQSGDANLIDSEQMLLALKIMNHFKFLGDNILIELINSENMEFIDLASKLNTSNEIQKALEASRASTDYEYETAYFASGKVFSSAFFDILMAQAYQTPAIFRTMNILVGTSAVYEPAEQQKKGDKVWPQSHLVLIRPPQKITANGEWQFQDLFKECSNTLNAIAIGLYRAVEPSKVASEETIHPYVITCPEPELLIEPTDFVFVLGRRSLLFHELVAFGGMYNPKVQKIIKKLKKKLAKDAEEQNRRENFAKRAAMANPLSPQADPHQAEGPPMPELDDEIELKPTKKPRKKVSKKEAESVASATADEDSQSEEQDSEEQDSEAEDFDESSDDDDDDDEDKDKKDDNESDYDEGSESGTPSHVSLSRNEDASSSKFVNVSLEDTEKSVERLVDS